MTTANTLQRANRVSIIPTADGYRADFYRTHKALTSVNSKDTSWTPAADTTKTAQREDFRTYITTHAAEIGISWQPEDQRTPANTRMATYMNDEFLKLDIISLLQHNISALIEKMPTYEGVTISKDYIFETTDMTITPKTTTAKGVYLSKMGIDNGKYLKTGYWAWADIECTVGLVVNSEHTIYHMMNVELVSGQLKKPHLTQTAWNASIKASLIELGLVAVEEPKPAKKATEKAKKATKTDSASEAADTTENATGGQGKATGGKRTLKGRAAAKRTAASKKGEATVAKVLAKIEAENAIVGDL